MFIQAWTIYWKTEIQLLERTQRRSTGFFQGISHLVYIEWRRILHTTSVFLRMDCDGLILVYQMLNMFRDWGLKTPANKPQRLRGHSHQLKKESSRIDFRRATFSQGLVNTWNAQPANVVAARSVVVFKISLGCVSLIRCTDLNMPYSEVEASFECLLNRMLGISHS